MAREPLDRDKELIKSLHSQSAWRNFSNSSTNQPAAKTSVGERLEVEYKADGTQQYAKYTSGTGVDKRITVMKQARVEVQGLFAGPGGEELRTVKESVCTTSKPTQVMMDEPAPLGVGVCMIHKAEQSIITNLVS